MSFSIIAAIGQNRELGKNGELIWHLPEDLRFFKRTTMGHPILMGRKTYESLPMLLPGRKHFVLTKNPSKVHKRQSVDGADMTEIVTDDQKFVQKYISSPEEIFVIGGGEVYHSMLQHCHALYLTEIEASDSSADTFFPAYKKEDYKREILGKGEENGLKYTFVRYLKHE